MTRLFGWVGPVLAICASCHRSNPEITTADPGPIPRPLASSLSDSEVVSAAIRRTVSAWSDALDKHDVGALRGFYGDPVRFYGRQLSKSDVLRAKQEVFARETTFHQTIVGDIDVERVVDGSATATFLKRSGPRGRFRDVHARLVLQVLDGAAPIIVEETDEASDRTRTGNEKGDADGSSDCEAEAARVVNDLPEVKRALASGMKAADESDGSAHFGGVGPVPDEDGGFGVGMGLHTDESFEAEIWYNVDSAGHLSVTVFGKDVAVRSDALRTVERACSHSRKSPKR